jgi:hypothetical protein
MQSFNWYLQRLRSMSLPEVLWRARSALRDQVDRPRFALGLYPSLPVESRPSELATGGPAFRIHNWPAAQYRNGPLRPDEREWQRRLLERADKLLRHQIGFFSLTDCDLGEVIDWNRDYESDKAAPQTFAGSIDYRDYRVTGDAKIVWELNRHHHLVVLARAYCVTGERRYAEEVVAQLRSWCQACPFAVGMNWRSPLELAIRLINWVWALDLIRDSGLLTPALQTEILPIMYLHVWEITRKYSTGSSANNHRIGEAAGVLVATQYFPALDPQRAWHEESRAILCEEVKRQTAADGGNREQAFGYHLFVLQFALAAGLVARQAKADLPADYWLQVNKMLEFAGRLTEGGDQVPMYGDCDDGYVLDLGSGPEAPRGLLAIGAILSGRSDFKAWAQRFQQAPYWLLGPDARTQFETLHADAVDSVGSSHAFADSGLYLLQCRGRDAVDRISVLFDCGELGFQSIAAHGHADALSFTLRAFGQEIFVDPGTYDYFRYPQWRTYFRSTRAHNTIVVDECDQSEMLGPFLWGARAQARCLAWEPGSAGARVVGEHNGYARLSDPVVHRRMLTLDGEVRTLTIGDDLMAQEDHHIEMFFHVAADCDVAQVDANRLVIGAQGGTVILVIDARLTVELLTASEAPIAGWVSTSYHQKRPTTTVRASAHAHGPAQFSCSIIIGETP